jgi:hypothetical protein
MQTNIYCYILSKAWYRLRDPQYGSTYQYIADWSEFTQVLQIQFGPMNPTVDAKDSLDNQCIIKYNINFNCLSIQTDWDNSVWHCYYSGLAKCIKEIIGQVGKPSSLNEPKKLTHSINSHHWECLCKKSHTEKLNPSNKSNKKPQSSGSKQQVLVCYEILEGAYE